MSVYVYDPANCRVQRFDGAGTFRGAFGTCGTAAQQFTDGRRLPIAVSPQTGDVYVGNFQAGVIRFRSDGTFVSAWRIPSFPGLRFHAVSGVRVHPVDGTVWITLTDPIAPAQVAGFGADGTLTAGPWPVSGACPDAGSALRTGDLELDASGIYLMNGPRMEKYSYAGQCLADWGAKQGYAPGEAELDGFAFSGYGLSFSPSGTLSLIASDRLIEYTKAGSHVRTRKAAPDFGSNTGAIAVDPLDGTLYVDTAAALKRYDLGGREKGYWTDAGELSGAFFSFSPSQVTPGPLGVYAPRRPPGAGSTVRLFSRSGQLLREIGVPCSSCTGAAGELFRARGVAVAPPATHSSPDDYPLGARITKFGPDGRPLLVFGASGSDPGRLSISASGRLKIGPDGLLYVADGGNRRIEVFDPENGVVRRVIGPVLDPLNPAVQFGNTYDIAFRKDASGADQMFVADPNGQQLWLLALDGTPIGIQLSGLEALQGIETDSGGDLYVRSGLGTVRRWRVVAPGTSGSDLKINKWGMQAVPGRIVDYTILVQNPTAKTARDVTVTEYLFPYYDFVSANPMPDRISAGNSQPVKTKLVWNLGALEAGSWAFLSYRARLDSGMAAGNVVDGTACISTAVAAVSVYENILAKDYKDIVDACGASQARDALLNLTQLATADANVPTGACGRAYRAAKSHQRDFGDAFSTGAGLACTSFEEYVLLYRDPNEKGVAAGAFILPDQTLSYQVQFENVGNIPAPDVIVHDVLDPRLGEILSISPGGRYDPATRTITWSLIGRFLAPAETDGVSFVVRPAPSLASGAVISNQASVVFDPNPAIATNPVTVTVDSAPPRSSVLPLTALSAASFNVCWQADDFGLSGVRRVTIFSARDGGAFLPLVSTSSASGCAPFTASTGSSYCFFSQAVDALGNTEPLRTAGDTCTTVNVAPPIITVPGDLTAEATGPTGAAVQYTAAATAQGGGAVTVSCVPPAGSTFAFGTTPVRCTATDGRGGTATATFHVTVRDTPPSLSLPLDQTIEATGPSGAVARFTASASDLADGSDPVICTPASGSTFPIAATTVRCTSTNRSGMTSSGRFTVIVQDTTPPALTVPANLSVDAVGPAGTVVVYAAFATDLVDPRPTVSCAPASGSRFQINAVGQSTVVSCTATDASRNRTARTFTVHVKGAVEQIRDLMALIDGFNLGRARDRQLDHRLADVLEDLLHGHRDACQDLASFTRHVHEAISEGDPEREDLGRLTAAQAAQITVKASQIEAVLSCPVARGDAEHEEHEAHVGGP